MREKLEIVGLYIVYALATVLIVYCLTLVYYLSPSEYTREVNHMREYSEVAAASSRTPDPKMYYFKKENIVLKCQTEGFRVKKDTLYYQVSYWHKEK